MTSRASKVTTVTGTISKLETDRTEEVGKSMGLIIPVWKQVVRSCFISRRVITINPQSMLFFISKRKALMMCVLMMHSSKTSSVKLMETILKV